MDLASFGFAELVRVTFEDCSLQRCEFSSCELTDLQGVAQLRGAAVDKAGIVANASLWAAALGIAVLDPD